MSLYWILLRNLRILILNWQRNENMLPPEVCRSSTLPLLVKHPRCQYQGTNFYNYTIIPKLSTLSRHLVHCTSRLCVYTAYRGYDVTSCMIYSSHPWFGQMPPRIVYKCKRQSIEFHQPQQHDTPGIDERNPRRNSGTLGYNFVSRDATRSTLSA
jgi:hypothetical protein